MLQHRSTPQSYRADDLRTTSRLGRRTRATSAIMRLLTVSRAFFVVILTCEVVLSAPEIEATPAGPTKQRLSSGTTTWVRPPPENPPTLRLIHGERAPAPRRYFRGTGSGTTSSHSNLRQTPGGQSPGQSCSTLNPKARGGPAAAGPQPGVKARQLVSSYMSAAQRRKHVAETLESDIWLRYGENA